MGIKVERIHGDGERLLVLACATNGPVLGQVAAVWRPDGLPSRWASLVVGWCVAYHRRHGRPPGLNLEGLFEEWRAANQDSALAELVGGFVASLAADYRRYKDGIEPQYALDTAARLMKRVALVETIERVQLELDNGEVDAAQAAITDFKVVCFGLAEHLCSPDEKAVAADYAAVRAAKTEPVVRFKGALGSFLDPVMRPGGFVAFMAGEKSGKSFWLQNVACTAYQQGRKVLYFEAGDSSRAEVLDRLVSRALGCPGVGASGCYPFTTRVPDDIEPAAEAKGVARVAHKERTWAAEISPDDAAAGFHAAGGETGHLILSPHPAGTLSVAGMAARLEQWLSEGFRPEVVVVDYADLLAPPNERAEGRDRINETWRALRSFSQKYNVLVATATQARRDGHTAWLLTREHISEDKRKLAEVTAMIGINRTDEEIEKQIWRLNIIAARGVKTTPLKYVITAGCLDIGNPAMRSIFPDT